MANNVKAVDPAFLSVVGSRNQDSVRNSTAFIIWRVEGMKLVQQPKDSHGKFHSGDSYLIYSSFEPGQPCGTALQAKEVRGSLERYVHFWLGSETTQDEAGVVAIKAIELDDYLAGLPVQQREVEGSESQRFKSYFKDGIRILPGGAASGFKHVTDEFHPALYSIKGKRIPIIRQLPEISWSAMNEGDVFVLDNKKYIFVWVGRTANNHEKMHGAKLAQSLKSDHGEAYSEIVIVEDRQELALPDGERAVFDKFLPIQHKKLKTAEEAGSDDAAETSVVTEIKLYRCTDEDGTLKVIEVKSGPLSQADLISNDSFIIDNGPNGIFVWVGKKATKQERDEAMRNGQGFAKKKEYPPNTVVTRVIDGGEPAEFRSLFRDWKVRDQTVGMGRQNSVGKVAKVENVKFDTASLHENPKTAAKSGMFDDGTGTKEVFRIVNNEMEPVPSHEHGRFYAGDCYVINYAYKVNGAEKNVIYYWLGLTSGQDEQGIAAVMAVVLDNKLGGRAVQVRVVQGKEPDHFLAIHSGKMVIYSGGYASSFEQQQGEATEKMADTYLLQVRGSTNNKTKAIEVPLKAASLNSNDVFVLLTPTVVYVWCGKGSTGDEREMAKQIASEGKADSLIQCEGQEKAEFWALLGGKGPYFTDKRTAEEYHEHEPRLFQCSNATGNMKVSELLDFTQRDLVEDDVMVLDAHHSVFIWVGVGANKDEVAKVEKGVGEYLRSDPKGRDPDTPVLKVRQGCEPPTFIGFFGVWDPKSWENRMDFEKMKEQMIKENPDMTIAVSVNGHSGDRNRYPLVVLQEKEIEKLPPDVDPIHRELSLHDSEFVRVFKMERQAFESLPEWKRQQLKKGAGIF